MGEASLVEQAKSGNKDALLELIMNQKDEYYRLRLDIKKRANDR